VQNVSGLFKNKAMVMSSLSWAFQLSSVWLMICNVLHDHGISASPLYLIYAVVAAILGVQCWWIWPKNFDLSEALDQKVNPMEARQSMLLTTGRYQVDFLEKASLSEMMLTADYIFLNMWYAVYLLYLQFYIMIVGTTTSAMMGSNMAVEFTVVLCTVSAAGVVVGYAMDKFGFGIIVLGNTLLSIGAWICLVSQDRIVQIVGFALYALSRVATPGIFFSFIGINFGFRNFGTLVGVGLFISGCFSSFQYLCLHIIENYSEHFWMNMFMAAFCAFCGGLYTIWLFSQELKEISSTAVFNIEEQLTIDKMVVNMIVDI